MYIVTIKGLGSGLASLVIAFVSGERISRECLSFILPALLLGFVAYGLSIFTYIRAQKELGAAITSAYYAIAPFIGAFPSFVILKESLSPQYLFALALMLAGTAFVVRDTLTRSHEHEQTTPS